MEIEFDFDKNEFVLNPSDIKNFLLTRIEKIPHLSANALSSDLIQVETPPHEVLITLAKRYNLKQINETTGLLTDEFKENDYLEPSTVNYLLQQYVDEFLIGTKDDELKELLIPGTKNTSPLYEGKSILRRLEACKIITSIYHSNDQDKLKILRSDTYRKKNLWNSDLPERMCEYFGSQIGFYFKFMSDYNQSLVWLSVCNFICILIKSQLFPDLDSHVIFSICCILWSIVWLELWKRKSSETSFNWGTIGLNRAENVSISPPRRQFWGEYKISEITGQKRLHFDRNKRKNRMILTWLIVIVNCVFTTWIMLVYYSYEHSYIEYYHPDDGSETWEACFWVNMPGIVYSIIINIYSIFYRDWATRLTEYENHETDQEFENQVILKYCGFEFINNFIALFYIAFVYNDRLMLELSVRNFFIVQLIINQILECVVPYFMARRKANQAGEKSITDKHREDFLTTFDEYLEIWLQFGHICLFASVYPEAVYLCILNNYIEIRTDAYRIINIYRKNCLEPAESIGLWELAFSGMTYVAIISNVALIFQSEGVWNYFMGIFDSEVAVILLAVFVEHLFIGGRFLLMEWIPDQSYEVGRKLAKMRFQAMKTLREKK